MIGRIYCKIQILSLDIVIGTLVLLRFFCIQFNVQTSWHVYVLLGVTVWLIYTLDHIRDAEDAFESKRIRYIFHRKYKKILIIISTCLIFLIIPLIFFIPFVVLLLGLLLGFLSFLYLFLQYRLSKNLSKELYVAVVYSAGILLVPMLINQEFILDIGSLLVLLSFTNLSLFSWFEEAEDKEDGFNSLATLLGTKNLKMIILILIIVGFGISILKFDAFHIFFFVGFLIYLLMIVFSDWFKINQRYRSIGDSIFMLPIFAII